MKKVLTIAGFDPSGGAGIQADLRVFQSLGVYGLSAVAALTAQSTKGVDEVLSVKGVFLKKQLDVLLGDLVPAATKIGMLLTGRNVKVVSEMIIKYGLDNVVLDPVFVSSSGMKLAMPGVPGELVSRVLPLCRAITPNIHEASVLSGINIKNIDQMKKAAEILKGLGPETVIITGGHLDGTATDVVFDGSFYYLKGRKRKGEYHGTGCIFSSALSAYLAKGCSVPEAAIMAKSFMAKAFQNTMGTGSGMKLIAL